MEIIQNLKYLTPELVLIGTILSIILLEIFSKTKESVFQIITVIGVLLNLIFSFYQYHYSLPEEVFSRMLLIDNNLLFWRMVFSVFFIVIIIMIPRRKIKVENGVYYALMVGLLMTCSLMVMSNNLLMMYFSFEFISLLSYILVGFSFDKKGSEASLKYFFFGATSSAIMLFGISILFSLTQTFDWTTNDFMQRMLLVHDFPYVVSVLLIIAGFLFKISIFPLHFWVPTVYSTAPLSFVSLMTVIIKLAGIAIFLKMGLIFNFFGQTKINWQTVLSILAFLTLLVGNFSALWQNNVRRILAYSTIAQGGFLIAGVACLSEEGFYNVLFYAVVYGFSTLGVFMIVQYFEVVHQKENLSDYKGVFYKYPLLSILLTLFLISLTGLPPMAGFTSKWLVFTSIWNSYQISNNDYLIYLFYFGLFNTVVSIFFYIKIPFYMIFRTTIEKENLLNRPPNFELITSSLILFMVLLFFFKPNLLLEIVYKVSFTS